MEPTTQDQLVLALCEVVRERRKKLNLSQSELSRRSGLHRSYIGDLERGARNLSVKNMCRLAQALEMSATELVRLAEESLTTERSRSTESNMEPAHTQTQDSYPRSIFGVLDND